MLADAVEAVGAVLVVIGLAAWFLPAAFVVAGVFLMRLAYSLEPAKARR